MKIIKRSGEEETFDRRKIEAAIAKANDEGGDKKELTRRQIEYIALCIEDYCADVGRALSVEEIQELVETHIIEQGAAETAKRYIRYRYDRSLRRAANTTDNKILTLIECNNEEVKQENANKNPTVNSVQRDYMAGEVSRDLTQRLLLPSDIVEAHNEGIIHFHDMDYYAQHMHNCDLVNLEDMLQNGTVISGTMIEKPHSFSTACNIATQIIAQVASNQYGGQSISLTHLAPFVDISRQKIRREIIDTIKSCGGNLDETIISENVEKRLRDEVRKGVQTIQYQVVTLMTTNGQAPFITVFMYLGEARNDTEKRDLAMIIEETLKQRYQGVKNESGVWITPAFPKLIYVLEEDNITPDAPYWYLTELAAKCTARRMVPDYISEKIMLQNKIDKNGVGHCYTCMGCRSFLTPYVDENGQPKYYGRFNQGVVTINLVDVALSSGGDREKFWRIFDERLELCYRALMCRHNRLKGTLSDAAPILWQNGALARLKKGETIDKLLYGGYSTISLGYAGLYECVKYMTGKSHTDPAATPFALDVMRYMNKATAAWKAKENIDFSLYGTPLESTTYRFAKCLQKRFGIVPGITDKSYITNSYHIHVTEAVDAFTKLAFEAQFQALSPGGAISYVEVPDMQNNIDAVLEVIRFIYDHIMYAELNTKSDYCQVCGYDGEIQVVEDDGKLVWECPKCHNRDQSKMNVARRTCGYIGTQFWNQGRTQEIRERVLHL
ncbi:MAG: anaerobic ribonucleoside-triphosphate reductase [Eubacteriales bacterium]|nr:anaerobic ribonucleoside-triphosphate reductase [Clostridiales bacterium]MDY3942173.1 anaerobic ribonucleoside-triphosphate reductase [Eubacteriales bacterium]